MQGLLSISRVIDAVNTAIGKTISWLILVAVIISAGNAIIRKVFSSSSNAWLEMQWYLFGAVFMLCAAWTLLSNEHIRIDVVNSLLPKRVRNWIDVVGHTLFLMPFCILLLYDSWPFFLKSYLQNEQSMNAGGLVVWPAKFLVVAGFVLLLFQGVSELIKRAAITRWPKLKRRACLRSPRPRACSTRPRSKSVPGENTCHFAFPSRAPSRLPH
ncbi:MAG: TRAP transport system small permease [Xanthobacteraceae bacterium]|nr:MAG: TRAP transport system small permease [Xanthobacteraceae bacterium]